MKKHQRDRCAEYIIITVIFMGILFFIFSKDINPLRPPREPTKQTEEIQTKGIIEEIDNMPKVIELTPELRKTAQHLTENLKHLEKDRLAESIPELPALKQQFEKTLRSWDARPTPTP